MAQPKTKRKSRPTVRFVKSPEPRKRAPKRATSRAAKRPSVVRRRKKVVHTDGIPNWGDLESGSRTRSQSPDWNGAFAAVPVLRLALMILAVAAVITLYVGHVHSTTELLTEVDRLRSENLELHLEKNLVKGSFDRFSGPAVVAARARELGLIEQVPNGIPITVQAN